MNTARNDITGDKIASKQSSKDYEDNHIAIFGERKLQEYHFDIFASSDSKHWSLRFPNDDTALYHAKKNNADRVTLNGVIIGEKINVGLGIYAFKKV